MSQPRIDIRSVAPDAQRGFRQAGRDAAENGVEPALKHLIDTRASQLNGCAYCLEMHVREAKALGESDDRLHLVAVWRETEVFTPRERARWPGPKRSRTSKTGTFPTRSTIRCAESSRRPSSST